MTAALSYHRGTAALVLGLGLWVSAAWGQETPVVAPEALTLTPAQAADLAERQALEIRQAREGIAQAQAAVGQAQSGRNLQASATIIEGRMGPVSTVTIDSQTLELGSDTIRQAMVNVSQPLYTGGRVESQVAAARAGVSVATAQTEVTIRALRRSAVEAVFAILRAKELAGVAQRQLEANREHLRLARARFAAGTAAQFDVVQAETQVASAEGNLVAAEVAVDQAVAGLRRVLALPQTQPVAASAPTEPVLQPAGDLPALIAVGWENRPELRALEAQVQAAEANLRLARATDALSAALAGQYQHNGSTAGFATSENSWQVTLSLSKPLWDGGLRKSLVQSAEANLRSSELAVETQRQQIALEITQQYLAASQALKQLQVATQGVVQAREAARIAEVRFQAEVGTGIEVIDAQTAQAAAEAAQINASHDLQLALVRLRDAMGQPLEGGSTP